MSERVRSSTPEEEKLLEKNVHFKHPEELTGLAREVTESLKSSKSQTITLEFPPDFSFIARQQGDQLVLELLGAGIPTISLVTSGEYTTKLIIRASLPEKFKEEVTNNI